jgi:hypothetical protein
MSINIVEELLRYSADDLKRWTTRDYTIIDKRLPNHVRNMLIEKIGNRQSTPETQRFFSDALEWLAAMGSHVPNKAEQMVR